MTAEFTLFAGFLRPSAATGNDSIKPRSDSRHLQAAKHKPTGPTAVDSPTRLVEGGVPEPGGNLKS